MIPSKFLWVATAALVASTLTTQAQAVTVYSLASDGTALIRFDSATPGAVTRVGTIAGGTSRLDGLDFRPSNGLLYGYRQSTGSVYSVDTSTGTATFAAALTLPTITNFLGIDFNPVADRLRIVDIQTLNLRVNVSNGLTINDGLLTYAAGDPSFGTAPNIIDAAYTRSELGLSASTTLYYIDYGTNSLVRSSNPNAGLMNTVGPLGFDIDANSGFDIYSNAGTDSAFAQFRVGGINGFYSIDLATGAATPIGLIGDATFMYGLAVAPGMVSAVPEPSSLALLGVGGLALLAKGRRQGRKKAGRAQD